MGKKRSEFVINRPTLSKTDVKGTSSGRKVVIPEGNLELQE